MGDYVNLVWQALTAMETGFAVNMIAFALAGLGGNAIILAILNVGK